MKSNEVLNQLAPDIQWVESYVAADKTFCVYLAKDEEIIRKHAEDQRLPGHQDHRSPQDDRPNHRATRLRHGTSDRPTRTRVG